MEEPADRLRRIWNPPNPYLSEHCELLEPEVAELHHSLGLLLVRRGRYEEAILELARAVELAPDQPRFAFVYAVALHDLGQAEQSLAVLEQAHRESPSNQEILLGLISFHREAGDSRQALSYARKLLAQDPNNADLQQLVRQLENPPI